MNSLMKKKNIYINLPFLTFPQLGIQFFNHFHFYFCFCFLFLIYFFLFFILFFVSIKQLTQFWIHFCIPYFFYSNMLRSGVLYFTFACYLLFFFLSFFSLSLLYIYLSLLLLPAYQYIINNYLLICSLITLKIY